ACQSTEVRVVIDAPELLRPRVGAVRVEVFDDDDQSVLMATRLPNDTGWPVTALLEPRNGDRSRGYRVEVRALAETGGENDTLLWSEVVEADGYDSGVETRNVLIGCTCDRPYAECVVNDGPAYYFRLEDGCSVSDEVGAVGAVARTNDAPCEGNENVQPVAGAVGMGLALLGMRGDGAAKVNPDPPNGLFQDSFSVELWFRSLAVRDDGSRIGMFIYHTANPGAPSEGFELSEREGEVSLRGIDGTATNAPINVRVADMDARLQHFVLTVERIEGGGAATLYVDGVAQASGPYPGTFDPTDDGEFGGHRGRSSGGEYDELAVYTRALTPNEVLNHWLVGRDGCPR
ncbi:MAG: LamG-like jellyroll fold domain-containing protein, partial [Myxococcota bacterium]